MENSMTSYKRARAAMILAFAAMALGMAGCSWFGKRTSYETARETRPLEVPPEFDAPSTANALSIPQVDSASASTAAPSDNAPTYESVPTIPIEPGSASFLRVGDGVSGAWRRVGLALERSGVAEVRARDEAAATYTLAGTISETTGDEGGFLKRMFTRERTETRDVTRVVRIVPTAEGGSEIRVEDESGQAADDAFARRVISALQARMG
jgi:uncharacterized lipoprotein